MNLDAKVCCLSSFCLYLLFLLAFVLYVSQKGKGTENLKAQFTQNLASISTRNTVS